MTAGYLDLQQRDLRETVIHPFASESALASHRGAEGQIASAEGSFYIFTSGTWQRIVHHADLAVLMAAVSSAFAMVIMDSSPGFAMVTHGFTGRPVVDVTGPDGSVMDVSVKHEPGRCVVSWRGALPTPTTVTVVGVKPSMVP